MNTPPLVMVMMVVVDGQSERGRRRRPAVAQRLAARLFHRALIVFAVVVYVGVVYQLVVAVRVARACSARTSRLIRAVGGRCCSRQCAACCWVETVCRVQRPCFSHRLLELGHNAVFVYLEVELALI